MSNTSHESSPAELISLADLIEQSATNPTTFTIADLYPEGETILMAGASHDGKTYLALDQGLAVAYGLPWLGVFEVPQPRPVLYVPSEGRRGIAKRVTATIAHRYDHLPPAPFYVYGSDLDLSEAIGGQTVARLAKTIDSIEAGFVIVDVLSDFAPGVDENSRDFGHVFNRLRDIGQMTGATILVLHHLGKDSAKGARGHSSLKAATDIEVIVKGKVIEDGRGGILATTVSMKNSKNRNEENFGTIAVDLRKTSPDALAPVVLGLWGGHDSDLMQGSDPALALAILRAEEANAGLMQAEPFSGLTRTELAKALGDIAPQSADDRAKAQEERGYIEIDRPGRPKPNRYRLTDKGRNLALMQGNAGLMQGGSQEAGSINAGSQHPMGATDLHYPSFIDEVLDVARQEADDEVEALTRGEMPSNVHEMIFGASR